MDKFEQFLEDLTALTEKHGLVVEWTVYGMMLGLSTTEFAGYLAGHTFEWDKQAQKYVESK